MGSRSMISSRRSSDEHSSKSANKSIPNEQTPLLVPTSHAIIPDSESCRSSRRSLLDDSKDTGEEAPDDFHHSDNQSNAKADTTIVGIISVLLLGTYLSQGKGSHVLILECYSRLFHRKCRWLNRISNIRYYLFRNWESQQWELAYCHLYAGRMRSSTNSKPDDFEFPVQSLKSVTP